MVATKEDSMKTVTPCSCGCVEPHIIARRTTADGVRVDVWSDGTLTQRGMFLRGLGTPRSNWAVSARARAARLVCDELELYNLAELPKVAAKTYAHTYSSEADRLGHVRVLVASALALALTACGPDAFYTIPPLADAGQDALEDALSGDADARPMDDAAADAAVDAVKGDAACELSGSTECTNVVAAYCARYAACCAQVPGSGNCSVGFDVPATCKTFYTQNGFDCSSGKYAKSVCGSGAGCSTSTNAATCSAIFVSSGPSESSFPMCPAFWGQF